MVKKQLFLGVELFKVEEIVLGLKQLPVELLFKEVLLRFKINLENFLFFKLKFLIKLLVENLYFKFIGLLVSFLIFGYEEFLVIYSFFIFKYSSKFKSSYPTLFKICTFESINFSFIFIDVIIDEFGELKRLNI
jgi:hypothetical protein